MELWVEKYRPKRVQDVVQQDEAKKLLENVIETGRMPHLLFFGPPGSGKTSAARALVYELFGKEEISNRVLELNASDERGIAVVREKIKTFTRTNVAKSKIHPITKRPIPPWKIVLLDEADMVTADAQAALRRIIEAHSKTSRFILICNYVHKIIDPLFSRCSPHRFEPVMYDAQAERIQLVCREENVTIDPAAIERLLLVSNGDMRRAINLLQSAAGMYDRITPEAIFEVSLHPPPAIVDTLLRECAFDQNRVQAAVQAVVSQGWDAALIVQELVSQVIKAKHLTDMQKARILFESGAKEYSLLQGSNAYLQLLSLFLKVQACLLGV